MGWWITGKTLVVFQEGELLSVVLLFLLRIHQCIRSIGVIIE